MDQQTAFFDSNISSALLTKEEYTENFSDLKKTLTEDQALIESDRCYFCYDAPCTIACPTDIDIPNFIKKIKTKNNKGAALEILSENILGGTCARACPVEILCEQACVRVAQEEKPVVIGALQRYATDWLFVQKIQPFVRKANTGYKIAVIGAGPAGLSCAHTLAREGHDVVIFDAKEKPGGLNEYGLAAYKMTDDFAQKEIQFIMSLGGIEFKHNQKLGHDFSLEELNEKFDAVFIGIGLSAVNSLELDNESAEHVLNAVDKISEIRQAGDLSNIPVGRKIIVIGGGNTAVDIASQMKRLGAEDVTLVYRRGPNEMGATQHEQEIVQNDGVKIKYWASPKKINVKNGAVCSVTFNYTNRNNHSPANAQNNFNKLNLTEETFTLDADMVFKAIGQKMSLSSTVNPKLNSKLNSHLKIEKNRIVVNHNQETSIKNVYAGGDCTNLGQDLTVQAVHEAKMAAKNIHLMLENKGAQHG